MLSMRNWAIGRWYVYTPLAFADMQAGSAGLGVGQAWLRIEPGAWPWSRIAPACLHAMLVLVLLFVLAEPVVGQQERWYAAGIVAQSGPSERDFTIVVPSGFAQTRPGPLGAALPREMPVATWRKIDSPLAIVIRAVPLSAGTTLAQYAEMKRAARRSLEGYTETYHASTGLSGQPAIDLEFIYRHQSGQMVRQRDVLVVFEQVGWAISWTHPEPVAAAVRAEGEAVVSSFRFRPPATVAERPAPQPAPAQPAPAAPPAPRQPAQPSGAPVALEPVAAASLVPLLGERGATVVRDQRVVRLAPGQASERFAVQVPPGMARLAIAATWPGSVVEVTLYRPDGEVALVRRGDKPPLVATVEAPMPGQWAYAATAVDVPGANYPVTLAAALAPAPAGAVQAAPPQQPGAVPPRLPRAGQPLPFAWLAFLGVVLAESGLWLRRRVRVPLVDA
jgi:hypothetical protein